MSVDLEGLNLQQKGLKKRDGGRVGGGKDKERQKKEGVAELDACKIRSEKMMCDQADCRQHEDGYITNRYSQTFGGRFRPKINFLINTSLLKHQRLQTNV